MARGAYRLADSLPEGEEMPGLYEEYARTAAGTASDARGPDDLTKAVGEGLAAVAFALLELAEAVRETRGE
jgi:hypothetical protein